MESFDVIIIGAGPAGLKCAEILGKSNQKVLLLEKNKEIGPKPCGGLMTDQGLTYLQQSIGEKKFNKLILNSILGKKEIEIQDSPLYTITREKLAQFQLKKLKKFRNLTIRTSSIATKIDPDFIIVNGQKIKFNFLVGADGSSSIVRRYLGLKTNKLGLALHYKVPTKKYSEIELFFNTHLFGPYYAWILPSEDYVSIGTGCDPKIFPAKKLIDNFNRWLTSKNIDLSKAKYEAHLLNYDYQGIEFGKIFLIGDAAGLIYDFTGEGIHPALISGEEVGEKIINPHHLISIDEILKKKKSQEKLTKYLILSGPLRAVLHELVIFLIKSKVFRKKVVKVFA
ncbi:MAG TPA: NAD(P)/FAD-dependent oxidoreductase [Candidatus Nanoarchaeia archaeon]|nr:NAD(P)/FAD-dependent oxidoreductase [Candidatus Nanoarchaeia archaeon]